MGNLTEVKTVFTIDLSPYLSGLKSMLTMTQQTGVQLKPLLNLQIDKANFTELEKTYDEYLANLKKNVPAAAEAAKAVDSLGNANSNEGKETEKATKKSAEKTITLNKMKREALESFGAIAFLTQGIVSLAATNSGGNKELEKMNQGLSKGISAGFGLAGVLGTLGVASGGVTVAIGAIVTVGVALLSFLDDGREKAKAYSDALSDFGNALRGASSKDLKEWAENLRTQADLDKKLVEDQKGYIKALDEDAKKSVEGRVRRANAIGAAETKLQELQDRSTASQQAYKKMDEQVTNSVANSAEVRKLQRDAEIASVVNMYARQRAEAKQTLQDDKARIKESTATAKEKSDALIAVQNKYTARITQINADEKKSVEQKQKEITEATKREAEKRKQIAEDEAEHISRLQKFQLQDVLNRVRLHGLQLGKSEDEISKDVLDRKKMAAEAELKLIEESEAAGIPLSNKTVERKAELEAELTNLAVEGSQMRIDAVQREKEQTLSGIQTMLSNIGSMFGTLFGMEQQRTSKTVGEEKKRKQAQLDSDKERKLSSAQTADQRAAIEKEYADKKTALDEEMDQKAKSQLQSAFALQKAAQIANAIMFTYSAAAAALAPPPLGLGPVFGPIVAATAIAAGLANVAAISQAEVPGLAQGTKISRPTFALIGEAGPEIVAPERTFVDVFKTDLAPRLIDVMMPQIKGSILSNISGAGNGGGVTIQIYIEQYYGTEEHFEKVLKPVIQDQMRRAGTNNAATLFVNQKTT